MPSSLWQLPLAQVTQRGPAMSQTQVTGSPLVLQRPRTAEQWPHQHRTTERVTLQWQGANGDTVSPRVCSSYQQLLHCQCDKDYTTLRQAAVAGSTLHYSSKEELLSIDVIVCRIQDVTFCSSLIDAPPKNCSHKQKAAHIFIGEVIAKIPPK